jgi:hypothetical protein
MEEVTRRVPMAVLAVVKRVRVTTAVMHRWEPKLRNLKHLCFQVLGGRNLDLMEAQPEQPGSRVVVVEPEVLVQIPQEMADPED